MSDHPDAVDEVAAWWFSAWKGWPYPDSHGVAEELRGELSCDALPVQVVALEAGTPVGSAVLKPHEMRQSFPDFEFWLGNVYVIPARRGKRLASKLALHVERIAVERGIPQLYLATEQLDGGLYARLGYEPVVQTEKRGAQVLVMVKRLS
ncbi:MAG: GNAT family N-acetyltransferase [Polyangiaceae bacterium]|nr:GNAT family N-acetyltransferase [Myxococcales bacterium]MCB9589150.1 GNAT family N-acetyltransferase [Polyangiaceae bacterium]MCB9610010.1 GNAT family N-acetyltransferase [Polyangiaceae bacterium]